jgi:hypothetical protein
MVYLITFKTPYNDYIYYFPQNYIKHGFKFIYHTTKDWAAVIDLFFYNDVAKTTIFFLTCYENYRFDFN